MDRHFLIYNIEYILILEIINWIREMELNSLDFNNFNNRIMYLST